MICPDCKSQTLEQMKDRSGRFICTKCGERFELQREKKKGILEGIFK